MGIKVCSDGVDALERYDIDYTSLAPVDEVLDDVLEGGILGFDVEQRLVLGEPVGE